MGGGKKWVLKAKDMYKKTQPKIFYVEREENPFINGKILKQRKKDNRRGRTLLLR